jgi:hypothetical protein
MNLHNIFPLMLLCSATVCAQVPDTTQGTLFLSPGWKGCPVELRAKLEVRARFVPVEQDKQATEDQGLHLTLSNARPVQVISAEIAVHGYPKGMRIMPTVLRIPDPYEIRRTFPIADAIAPGESISFDLPLKGLSTVDHIDVVSLTYADGSIWHPANLTDRQPCRAFGRTAIEATAWKNTQ